MASSKIAIGKRPRSLPPEHTDETACVICLDECSERAKAEPCGHDNFDFICLVSWLQEQLACPLCKYPIKTVRYRDSRNSSTRTYNPRPPEASSVQTNASSHSPFPRSQHWRTQRIIRPNRPRRRYDPSSADTAILRRRHIYRNRLYSCHVGTNRLSRFSDLSPEIFSRDDELISRARKWIRRELQVFEFLNANEDAQVHSNGKSLRRARNAEFLLEYIVAILKTVDIKGSGGQAEDMLQEFLGRENARLFLHELGAWLRSPYTSLSDWDRAVQYDEALSKRLMDAASPAESRGSSQESSSTKAHNNRAAMDERSRERIYGPRTP